MRGLELLDGGLMTASFGVRFGSSKSQTRSVPVFSSVPDVAGALVEGAQPVSSAAATATPAIRFFIGLRSRNYFGHGS